MNVQKLVVFALLGVALAGCGQSAVTSLSQPTASSMQGRAQAGFTDLKGRPVSITQFKGHPVVLSFLNPQQADSQAQLPHLIRLAAAYQSEGVVFVVGGETPKASDLVTFVADHGLTFPVWHDGDGSEFRRRGFSGLPAHEFLRTDGLTASRQQGFMSRGELLEAIARINP